MKTILVGFIIDFFYIFLDQIPEIREDVILWTDQFAQLYLLESHVCDT